jgi:uncharacterized protein YpiB (UPF0302 family)
MSRPQRQEVVKRVLNPIELSDLEGSAEEIFKLLKDVEKEITDKGFHSIRFSVDNDYDSSYLEIEATRMETDAEYARRLIRERDARAKKKKMKARKEETELQLYGCLKKKFGK